MNISENLFANMESKTVETVIGGKTLPEAAETAVSELSGEQALSVYSETMTNALNKVRAENREYQVAVNAFQCAATGNSMTIIPPIHTNEEAEVAQAVLDALLNRVVSQLFIQNPEDTKRESAELDALQKALDEYKAKLEKAESEAKAAVNASVASADALSKESQRANAAERRVSELESELAEKKDSPLEGSPADVFMDVEKWGGVFSDIGGLLEPKYGEPPITDYEAALAVRFCGIRDKDEYDAVGGFVNPDFVGHLKVMLLRVRNGRKERVLLPPPELISPSVCFGWRDALSVVRAYFYLSKDKESFGMPDAMLYGKLRDIYAQTDKLDKFTPESVENGFTGKINGFLENLQIAADSHTPESDEDDDLPFVMSENPTEMTDAEKRKALQGIIAARGEANAKIADGLKSYKENPAAWKPLIAKRREESGSDDKSYPDADIVNDLLVQNPSLRPEGVAPAKEIPDFKGFEPYDTLAVDGGFFERFVKNWILQDGGNWKDRIAFVSDVKPVLMKDPTIRSILDPQKFEVDERLFVAMAACGGLINYRTAVNLLKYKEDGGEWQEAYRKFVGALALSCCVQMTEFDGLGADSHIYAPNKVSESTGTPAWVDEYANKALHISGYSGALVSMKLETRAAAVKKEREAPDVEIADRDRYFYNGDDYEMVKRGQPLDISDTSEEVSEDIYKRGKEEGVNPDRARVLIGVDKACRLWDFVPAETAWEKALDKDYEAEWEEMARAYAKTDPASGAEILRLLNSPSKMTVLSQYQTAYRKSHTPMDAFKSLLGEDFGNVAPWEPRETANVSEECAEISKAWYEYVGEQE